MPAGSLTKTRKLHTPAPNASSSSSSSAAPASAQQAEEQPQQPQEQQHGAAALVFRVVVPPRKPRRQARPTTWGQLLPTLTLFNGRPGVQVCTASNLLHCLHRDSNHVKQEHGAWQACSSITLASMDAHCFKLQKPVVGISGSPPLVVTVEAAKEIAVNYYNLSS